MTTDWTPCINYAGTLSVPSGQQTTMALMDNLNWSTASQVVGTVEDENRNYKILRIVGYWTIAADAAGGGPDSGSLCVRVWPGFQNTDTGQPTIPGFAAPPGTVAEQQLSANEKWWWERMVPWPDVEDVGTPWERASAVAHPYSYMADFKPNMWMGDSFTPAVSIANGTNRTVNFIHRWRALVAY